MMKKLNEENYVGEIWKDIKGYEGLYQVSNLGRVRNKKTKKILKTWLNQYGYIRVSLHKNGKQKWHLVHRLVYEAFIGEIPNGMQVNHKDENKENNVLSNIDTLMTCKENNNWGTHNERSAKTRSNNQKRCKIVIQKSLDGKVIRIWPSIREIQRKLGYLIGAISKCCRCGFYRKGKWINYTQAYGYLWQYEEDNTK